MSQPHPAYRIRTRRLELRCWDPRDAVEVHEAIARNKAHLEPYMPWARESATVDDMLERIRGFRGRFDLGEDFVYGLFEPGETRVVGGAGLRTRAGAGGLEVGYWVDHELTRRGYATEVTAALTRVGFDVMDANRIEICCQEDNVASRRIPEKLGFEEEGLLRNRLEFGDEAPRDLVSYCLTRGAYASNALSDYDYEAFDALDRRIDPSATRDRE